LLSAVDAVVTDPPYGIGADKGAPEGGVGRFRGKDIPRQPKRYEGDWDSERPSKYELQAIVSAAKVAIIWGGNHFSDLLPRGGRWLVWDKVNSMPTFSDAEMAWTNIPGASVKLFSQCNSGKATWRDGRFHPTQKPINLMGWCLEFVSNADIILDPYMGSGTTGIAAIRMGKAFIGIEREPQFFEVACRRIREVAGEDVGPLFGDAA
jgi:site-specific DNA-methyltransferase (adenine-specific)/modification methylase